MTKIIDQLHQHQHTAVELYGQQGDADVKSIISKLAEMKCRMMTDRPLQDIAEDFPNADIWNTELEEYRKFQRSIENVTWYKTPWLFVECYLYCKILEFFWHTTHFREYDPFRIVKERSYTDSMAHLLAIGTEVVKLTQTNLSHEEIRKTIVRLLQFEIWGNKSDLSLSGGDPHFMSDTIFQELDELKENILTNDLDVACNTYFMCQGKKLTKLVIVLDNAGLELFTDLCFADFLISKSLVDTKDFEWVLSQVAGSDDEYLKQLGARWQDLVAQKKFVFKAHHFWTFGYPYCDMEAKSPELYNELKTSSLIIFKGDLNYRKLVGDRYWPIDTPFSEALCGFEPAPLLALSTLKAKTVAVLSQTAICLIESKFQKDDLSWMVSSDYAVAQLFTP
ncbi:protein-glutamate O-methyltransferase [Ditylenchus destructor]|uniref:Sugar phosphate phosphatase n=1 Tax=Ditylenchus destructor TaxID=166010 RepID=A0AAD4NDU2_9BILA|nr:protein-glutamate O-methyltransferase [Ditylenchus destructor]